MDNAKTPLLPDALSNFRAGYVAVIGLPNVGKSTLLNHLLKQKISIVTAKPQTTRKNVLGILNGNAHQIVFLDTPGILDPQYNLQKVMMRSVKSAIKDADIIVYMMDILDTRLKPAAVKAQLAGVSARPVILAINKIDKVDKQNILPFIQKYRDIHAFKSIIPISAEQDDGLDQLVADMVGSLPFSPPYYPTDYISDQQERFFVAEIIREKIFSLYSKEVPYATHVDIEEFSESEDRKDLIRAVIYVERKTQKSILIGKKGQSLKQVGASARIDIERFLGRPVFLSLFVKVSPDWRKKDRLLRQLGYS